MGMVFAGRGMVGVGGRLDFPQKTHPSYEAMHHGIHECTLKLEDNFWAKKKAGWRKQSFLPVTLLKFEGDTFIHKFLLVKRSTRDVNKENLQTSLREEKIQIL